LHRRGLRPGFGEEDHRAFLVERAHLEQDGNLVLKSLVGDDLARAE
jgi:hypothetical protein